jgi:glycosyltransferase involved in cell wall biosynthesis
MTYFASMSPSSFRQAIARPSSAPYLDSFAEPQQAAYAMPYAFARSGPSSAPLASARATLPLRAVHVGPCFARGGSEQHLIDLARFLDPSRVRIDKCIVTNPEFVDPEVVRDMPAPVEVGGADAVRRAAKEYDVLLFWGPPLDDWLEGHRPKLCVFIAHGAGNWTRDILQGSSRVVDHVIAVSNGVREQVCNGFPVTVIPNGVDAARLAQSRSRRDSRALLGFAEEDFVLGYVGRFSPEKRVHLLVRAVASLPPRFKALMVGWGPVRGELIELANELIPGRFAVRRADRYLGDFYQALDAFCLFSEHEGFALVVLEAMTCGRPVIATAVGAVPEAIVDRVSGIVVRPDVNSICEAARLLCDHPDWARGLAAEGRAMAEQHGSARRMARQYEDLLIRLWSERQRIPG